MNHHDEFCKFIRSQAWMSPEFGDTVIRKMAAAMSDAYDRGKESFMLTHTCVPPTPLPTLDQLSKRQINELKAWLRGKKRGQQPFPGSPVINAIKRVREMTGAPLRDSKFYIDRLQEQL